MRPTEQHFLSPMPRNGVCEEGILYSNLENVAQSRTGPFPVGLGNITGYVLETSWITGYFGYLHCSQHVY